MDYIVIVCYNKCKDKPLYGQKTLHFGGIKAHVHP